MDKKSFFKKNGGSLIFLFVVVIPFGFLLFYELGEFKRIKELNAIMYASEPYYLTERNVPIVLFDKNKEAIYQLIDSTTNNVYQITARIVYVVWDSTRKTEILSYNLSSELGRLGVKLAYDKDACIYSYGDYSLKIPFGQVKLDAMYAKINDSNKKQYKERQDKWKKYYEKYHKNKYYPYYDED